MRNRLYYKRKKKSAGIEVIFTTILIISILGANKKKLLSEVFEQSYILIYLAYGLIFLIAASLIWKYYKNFITKNRLLKSRIFEIDKMSGVEFERLLKAYFEKQGYNVSLTSTSNDYGADLVLKKGGTITVVQAKRYKGKVGNKAVQEIVGAKGYYNAKNCMVVSNSFYTTNAIALAKANDVLLWDRNDLTEKFRIN